MSDTWIPWSVAALLAMATFAAVALLLLRRRRWQRSLQAERADHERRVHRREEEHAQESERVRTEHARELARADRRSQEARALADRLHSFSARALGPDLASRDLIASVCEDLALDGVLATNVVFVPVDVSAASPYVAQVDHVLLTDRFALLIENKNWRGVIFDGVRPSSILSAFSWLIDEADLEPPFALQFKRADVGESASDVAVMARSGKQAPTTQVRIQAHRLAGFVRAAQAEAPWFNTAVLYSHRQSTVYKPRAQGRGSTVRTDVMAGPSELRNVLARLHRENASAGSVSPLEVAPLLARHGADMLGLGRHCHDWRSLVHQEKAARAEVGIPQ